MKHLVNGREWEPVPGADATVTRAADRLLVKTRDGEHSALVVRSGGATLVSYRGHAFKVERLGRRRISASSDAGGEARAPMPGQIVEVTVEIGAEVAAGDRLLVLEAMKMQQPVVAPCAGRVASLSVAKGDQVEEGQVLAVVS